MWQCIWFQISYISVEYSFYFMLNGRAVNTQVLHQNLDGCRVCAFSRRNQKLQSRWKKLGLIQGNFFWPPGIMLKLTKRLNHMLLSWHFCLPRDGGVFKFTKNPHHYVLNACKEPKCVVESIDTHPPRPSTEPSNLGN